MKIGRNIFIWREDKKQMNGFVLFVLVMIEFVVILHCCWSASKRTSASWVKEHKDEQNSNGMFLNIGFEIHENCFSEIIQEMTLNTILDKDWRGKMKYHCYIKKQLNIHYIPKTEVIRFLRSYSHLIMPRLTDKTYHKIVMSW